VCVCVCVCKPYLCNPSCNGLLIFISMCTWPAFGSPLINVFQFSLFFFLCLWFFFYSLTSCCCCCYCCCCLLIILGYCCLWFFIFFINICGKCFIIEVRPRRAFVGLLSHNCNFVYYYCCGFGFIHFHFHYHTELHYVLLILLINHAFLPQLSVKVAHILIRFQIAAALDPLNYENRRTKCENTLAIFFQF